MKNITLKLYDYLTGECAYQGCLNNNGEGICLSNNEEHLAYITKIVDHTLNKNQGKIENVNIVCSEIDVEDGYCEWCGEKLMEIHERHPYGDTYATEILYECPNPKCN